MNAQSFVNAIELYVRDSSLTSTLNMIAHPSGESPARGLVELSRWLSRQGAEDRRRIESIIQLSVDGAVHSMLTVLDGCQKITTEAGDFELTFVKKDGAREYIAGGRRSVTNELYQFAFDWQGSDEAP